MRSRTEIKQKIVLYRSLVVEHKTSSLDLYNLASTSSLALLSKIIVLLSENAQLCSHFANKLSMLQLQLLNLFIFLAVGVGQLNFQLFCSKPRLLLCLIFDDNQPFQLFFLLTFGSSDGLFQFFNLQILLPKLHASKEAFIFNLKCIEVIFHMGNDLSLSFIFSTQTVEIFLELTILFSEFTILYLKFITAILFDDPPQFFQIVAGFVEAALIYRSYFLKLLQFLRSGLFFFNQLSVLALKLLNLLQLTLHFLLEDCHSFFEYFFCLPFFPPSAFQINHHYIVFHLISLLFCLLLFSLLCLPVCWSWRSSLQPITFIGSPKNSGSGRIRSLFFFRSHLNIELADVYHIK